MCATHFGHGLQPWSVMPSAMPGPIVLSNYNTSFAFRGAADRPLRTTAAPLTLRRL